MAEADSIDREILRVRVVQFVMLGLFLLVIGMLWRIQILRESHFKSKLATQSIRRVSVPGRRGAIYDRNGLCLADNRPNYCIAVYVDELREPPPLNRTVDKVMEQINAVAELIQVEPQVTRDDLLLHIRKRRPMPLLAWCDVDQTVLARFEECPVRLAGIDIIVESVRVYPQGKRAAHLLGYVGKTKPEQDEEWPYHFYETEMVGKQGIEKVFNETLKGESGVRLIEVDASMFKHRVIEKDDWAPESGQDVALTIDSRIQRLAEEAIVGNRGAVVVVDPRNGEVLALASAPAFDPNDFIPYLPAAEWEKMRNDPANPMMNRATIAKYPPGSIIKPVIALAALEKGMGTGTAYYCPGYYKPGRGRPISCWRKSGHGQISMDRAIEQSCNTYFCRLGLSVGYENIYNLEKDFGLGCKTGISLDNEASGLLPNDAWKRRHRNNDGWRAGDTCNVSIGQGFLLTTPLQMAVVVSALANGGIIHRPKLVIGDVEPETSPRRIRASQGNLAFLRRAMTDVVQSNQGTGKRARVKGVEMAGKTGTAQHGNKGKKHGWMMLFAPAEKPRYAVVVIVENVVSAGVTTAPCVKKIMKGIFELEATDANARKRNDALARRMP